ncbi:MAG: purine-nucleoside phosphorylase, partial [Halobacteriovoraceae bacterium]|nr:purine-nucleoside phosphorylase [Halobacteriovoraceae bacterium]
ILGKLQGVSIAVLQGRSHIYEGIPLEDIVFPVRILASLGIKNLIITNAAGGINRDYSPGDLVIISDHINLMGDNPLIGENHDGGPRFPDMTSCWNPALTENLSNCFSELKMDVKKGVYAALPGPSYETPAEIRMLRTLGADMVGMSSVPELIAAHHLGVKCCGISCISNMAAGLSPHPLSHHDVELQAKKAAAGLKKILGKSVFSMS